MENAAVTGAHGVQYRPYSSGDASGGIETCFHTKPLWSSIRDGEAIYPNSSIQQTAHTDKTVKIWQLNKKEASSERIQAAQLGIKRLRRRFFRMIQVICTMIHRIGRRSGAQNWRNA